MNLPAAPARVVQPTALLTGDEAQRYAKKLSESTMVPNFFQGSISNMLYAMELGKLYGLAPTAILQNIHVFETYKDGKPTLKAGLSANLMVMLARKAGHIVTSTSNVTKATTTIVRGDSIFAKLLRGDLTSEELDHYGKILTTLKDLGVDAKQHAVTEAVWNEQKAITAGLFGKGNWAKYPHAMLAARAKTDAVRLACEEVLIQLADDASRIADEVGPLAHADGRQIDVSWGYTADELDAPLTDEGTLVKENGEEIPASAASTQPPPARPKQSTVTTVKANGTPDPKSAAADIAAQAAADPSRAGWGKSQAQEEEQKAAKPSVADTVRAFVEAKPFDDTLGLLTTTLTNKSMDDTEIKGRTLLIAVPVAETMDVAQIHLALGAVAKHKPDLVKDFLIAVADNAPASRVAEMVQEIAMSEDVEVRTRLEFAQIVHGQLKINDRADDPATFYDKQAEEDKAVSLAEAIRDIVQPLIAEYSTAAAAAA